MADLATYIVLRRLHVGLLLFPEEVYAKLLHNGHELVGDVLKYL